MYKTLAGIALLALTPYSMAEAFVEITDIPGDSLIQSYENQIAATEWSQGAANVGNGAVFLPLRFTHRVDQASPLLVQAALNDTSLEEVILHVVRQGGGGERFEYFTLELTGARIVSVKSRGDIDTVGFEEVTIDCSSFTLTYTPQLGTGAPGTPIVTSGTCGR